MDNFRATNTFTIPVGTLSTEIENLLTQDFILVFVFLHSSPGRDVWNNVLVNILQVPKVRFEEKSQS